MMDFLRLLEQSAPIVWLREGGSIWGYPAVLFLHTLGLGTVAGVSSVINLRFLGFGRRIPLPAMRPLFGLVWTALAVTAASGFILLVADAINKLSSPVFYVKMVFVICGVLSMRLLKRELGQPKDARTGSGGGTWALVSIACWIAAVTAGRLMAYIGPIGAEGF